MPLLDPWQVELDRRAGVLCSECGILSHCTCPPPQWEIDKKERLRKRAINRRKAAINKMNAAHDRLEQILTRNLRRSFLATKKSQRENLNLQIRMRWR